MKKDVQEIPPIIVEEPIDYVNITFPIQRSKLKFMRLWLRELNRGVEQRDKLSMRFLIEDIIDTACVERFKLFGLKEWP